MARDKMHKVTMTKWKVRWTSDEMEDFLARNPSLHRKLAYAVGVNLDAMEPVIKGLLKAERASKAFSEYEEARIALCQEYADRDAENRPVMAGRNYVITERRNEFDSKVVALRAEPANAQAIAERDRQLEQLEDLYEEEVEISVYVTPWEFVPERISGKHMRALRPFLDGEPQDDLGDDDVEKCEKKEEKKDNGKKAKK